MFCGHFVGLEAEDVTCHGYLCFHSDSTRKSHKKSVMVNLISSPTSKIPLQIDRPLVRIKPEAHKYIIDLSLITCVLLSIIYGTV